jgi:hypothetical protein
MLLRVLGRMPMRRSDGARAQRAHRPLVDDLIHAAQADDRPAFDQLFDLWFDAVYVAAKRDRAALGADAAGDVTAELLRRTLRKRLPTSPSP